MRRLQPNDGARARRGIAAGSVVQTVLGQEQVWPAPGVALMTKPHRKLKKANHGARPANSKARKQKRKHIRT